MDTAPCRAGVVGWRRKLVEQRCTGHPKASPQSIRLQSMPESQTGSGDCPTVTLPRLSFYDAVGKRPAEMIVGSLDNWFAVRLAQAAARNSSHRVPKLQSRKPDAFLATLRAEPSPGQALSGLLCDLGGFHGFGQLLAHTSATSMRNLWPWFAAVAAETVSVTHCRYGQRHDDGSLLERYRLHHGVEFLPAPAVVRNADWLVGRPRAAKIAARQSGIEPATIGM